MHKKIKPKVTLIGAGPGDPDLLTIKGAKALALADVILYDALVNPEILELSKPDAIKVYVGKRCGNHKYSQDEINQILVDYTLNYTKVVRLKGGDPFVFGRGIEEVTYASAFGIECEVVPGITSAIAVPMSQNISITHRHISESFWVLTATISLHKLSKDIALAAQSSATLVILMGMNKLSEIINIFKDLGKQSTAIAVIQDGTTANEKVGVGTIENIEQIVAEKSLQAPAIIVIGEVVRYNQKFMEIYEHIKSKKI